ncbi:hypothetical protein WHZ77_02585 [Bradyrhizobium sp. A5]|uniref:helix-turn-helix domain-containing protein n=1 Tax=Bradyrhizobium sp. A5 TaxID=3133696 RepID=UPI00324F0AEA
MSKPAAQLRINIFKLHTAARTQAVCADVLQEARSWSKLRPHRPGDCLMPKRMIRPLRSESDYDSALEEIERYFESEPKPGTPEGDRFDLLALVIEDYERKHWPIDPPDAVDAIRYRMETGQHTQADLGRLLGSRQRATS